MHERIGERLLPLSRFIMRMALSVLLASAIFSGLVFLSAVGIVPTPVFHRVLHKVHMNAD